MKIGIYSGSFNPIHSGHAMLAEYILKNCDIDELWLMVTPQNPLKQNIEMADNYHRYEMAKIVAEENHLIKVSDFEFNLPQPTYTYTTLCKLKEHYPEHEFILIIGSDNWLVFDKWHKHEQLIEEFKLLIYPRPGYNINEHELPENITFLSSLPQMEISSTEIRKYIKLNKNLSKYLPNKVINYIKQHKLYE